MSLALLDWRRRVANLYAEVRAEPDVVAAHDHWRRTRDDLLRTHPESPVPQAQRARYPGAPVTAYDPRLRFDAPLDTGVPPKRMHARTGTDGIVSFDRIGCVHLPGGDLDVWWLGCYGGGIFIPVKDGSAGSATYGGGQRATRSRRRSWRGNSCPHRVPRRGTGSRARRPRIPRLASPSPAGHPCRPR